MRILPPTSLEVGKTGTVRVLDIDAKTVQSFLVTFAKNNVRILLNSIRVISRSAASISNGCTLVIKRADPTALVAATLSTNLTGTNNDLTFTALAGGSAGNGINVTYVDPAAASAALSVETDFQDITVNLATADPVASTLETNLTGTNNDIKLTAQTAGVDGDNITLTIVDPAGNDAVLEVTVDGTDITVNCATDGSSAITSTAAQVMAAINDNEDAFALVVASLKTGNDGTGVVTALSETPLASGSDGGSIISTAAEVQAAIEADATAAALVSIANKSANDGTGVVTAMSLASLTGGADYTAGTDVVASVDLADTDATGNVQALTIADPDVINGGQALLVSITGGSTATTDLKDILLDYTVS